ncbi:MAG: hypothetical protein DGJ47_001062 [Rickettsiaceae bacterium]
MDKKVHETRLDSIGFNINFDNYCETVILIGPTNAGKSTMSAVLSKKEIVQIFYEDEDDIRYDLKEQNSDIINIEHGFNSGTIKPVFIKSGNRLIVDCPGFLDSSRNAVVRFNQSLQIKKIFDKCKNVKVILVVSSDNINSINGLVFLDIIEGFLKSVQENNNQIFDSLGICLTKIYLGSGNGYTKLNRCLKRYKKFTP